MSTTLRIVSQRSDTFGNVVHGSADDDVVPLKAWDSVTAHNAGMTPRIVRREPGRGYAINEGPATLRIAYVHQGEHVGPIADYLAPGECKELGLGKNVEWVFAEV